MLIRGRFVLCLALALGYAPAYGQNPAREHASNNQVDTSSLAVPGEIIVRYVDGLGARERVRMHADLALDTRQSLELINADVIAVNPDSTSRVLAALATDPRVAWAEPNYIVRADVIPSDPEFPLQWGLHNVGQSGGAIDADVDAAEAWDIETGRPVLIGIIDSGIDTAHPDLHGNLWTNPGEIPGNGIDDDGNGYVDDVHGWDFYASDNDPHDENGHGTHVAGIVAAVGNNGIGIAGVAWEAQLVPLRFLNAAGSGPISRAVEAIHYAIAAGIRLTCNSWGGGTFSQALHDAIDSANAHGMLLVAAAGNERTNADITPHYPSGYPADNVISVAATDHHDRLADEALWGSNWGPKTVDLGAPGVAVYSTIPGGYLHQSGTSMAAPHVAGAAALLWSQLPELGHRQVKARLLATGDVLPGLVGRTVSGRRLNAFAALDGHETDPPSAVTDLAVTKTEGSRVTLRWTAPGDDGMSGQAARYRLAWALSPIDSAGFADAVAVTGLPLPGASGSFDSVTVTGLDFATTYYFALVAEDDWFNLSPLSNLAVTTTLGPPVAMISIDSVVASAHAGSTVEQSFELTNAGAGELMFASAVEYKVARPPEGATAATEEIAPATKDVLLVYADGGATGLQAILDSFPDIGRVDLWFAGAVGGSIPTYDDVAGYDVLVAWNNKIWADIYQIGALLADFIDSGGAVVTLVDAWGSGLFTSRGRYFETPGYSPFASTGEALFEVHRMGWYDTAHPVMRGVQSLAIGSYYNQVVLTSGAREIAQWDDGTPLVASQARTVAINVWPGDGYHWIGDFPALIHNAIRYAAGDFFWFRLEPSAGEIAPGSTRTLTAHFDASQLIGGTYTAAVTLSTNDPLMLVQDLPVRLEVQGTARLDAAQAAVEFGEVYMGHPPTRTLLIQNSGTDRLHISEITFDLVHFTSELTSLSVEPGERAYIPIRFSPPAIGEMWASMFLATNDPAMPVFQVSLHATTVEPPALALQPGVVQGELYVGGVAQRTMVIANEGKGRLDFDVHVRGAAAPMDTTAARHAIRIPGTTAEEEAGWVTDPDSGGPGVDIHTDGPDSVHILAWVRFADRSPNNEFEHMITALSGHFSEFVLETTTETDPAVLDSLLYDCHVFLVPEQENALPELLDWGHDWSTVLRDFVARGGTVVFGQEWGNSTGFIRSTGLLDVWPAGRDSDVRLNLVQPDHPLASGLPDSLRGTNMTAWYTLGTDDVDVVLVDSAHQLPVVVSRAIGAGRAILFGFDYYVYNDAMARLFANAISLAHREFNWLELTPVHGTVNSGDSVVVEVRLTAQGLTGGDYHAEISVATNDPERNRESVYAHLQVTDAPHLVAEPASLDFGTVFVGTTDTLDLVIVNGGSLALAVTEAVSSQPEFGIDTAGFELAPDEYRLLSVTFTPSYPGRDSGTVHLLSNDPDQPDVLIAIAGTGSAAPLLVMDGDTTRGSLYTGEQDTAIVRLANLGGSPLVYEFLPRLEEDSAAGVRIAFGAVSASGPSSTEPELTAYADDWSPRAPLPYARSQFSMVAHPDNHIYAFGGWGQFNAGRSELYRYSPEVDAWSVVGPTPASDRGMATAVDRDGRVYAFSATVSESFRYDPLTDTWTTLEAPPVSMVLEAGAVLGADGRIYLIGGEGSGPDDPLGVVQIFDPALDVWTLGAPMPTPRYQLGVARGPGGLIYAVGGRTGFEGEPVSAVEVYDPVQDAWSTCAPLPTPRCQLAVCAGVDGRLYAVGGRRDYLHVHGTPQTVVEVYDPELDVWVNGPALPSPRGGLKVVRQGTRIYAMGGADSMALATNQVLQTRRWLGLTPAAGTVPAGDTLPVAVTLDAYGLPGGVHRARLRLTTNDPAAPVLERMVEVEVAGAPDLRVYSEQLVFDTVPVGRSIDQPLVVSNVGATDLHLQAELTTSMPFALSAPELILAPGADSVLYVTFAPGTPGDFAATLRLTSDDPHTGVRDVPLAARALPAPRLEISPDSLVFDLQAGSEQEDFLLVTNPSEGTLEWQLGGLTASPTRRFLLPATTLSVAERGTALDRLGAAATQEPVRVEAIEADLARLDGVRIGITDPRFTPVYTGIQSDLETRGAMVRPILRPFTPEKLDSIDVLALDGYVHNLFDSDFAALRTWLSEGHGLLLQNSYPLPFAEAVILLAGTGVAQYGTSVHDVIHTHILTHPTTVGVDSVQSLAGSLFLQLDAPARPLVLDSAGRAHAAASVLERGRVLVVDNEVARDANLGVGDTRLFVNRIFDWLTFGTTLTADPLDGILPPGGQQQVRVRTETAYLVEGDYRQALRVQTNVPGDSVREVPVSLHVTGEPRIEIATDTLDLGLCYVGFDRDVRLAVRNSGTALLTLQRVTVAGAGFQADSLPVSIPVFGVEHVGIRVSPEAPGPLTGVLTIESDAANAPVYVVPLRAEGLMPPEIELDHDSVQVELRSGDSTVYPIRLWNRGVSALEFRVDVLPTHDLFEESLLAARAGVRPAIAGDGHRSAPGEVLDVPVRKGVQMEQAQPVQTARLMQEYAGDLVRFGITDVGEVYPFRYPGDTAQLWWSGYAVSYVYEQIDRTKSVYMGIGPVIQTDFTELVNDTLEVIARWDGETDDGLIAIRRLFRFERRQKYVSVTTRLVNRTGDTLENVVFKSYADWDIDITHRNDSWDYDRARNLVFGHDRRWVGLASSALPTYMDIEGRNDYFRRGTTVDFPNGPVTNYDGQVLLHIDVGDIPPGDSSEILTTLAVGDTLDDLLHEIDRGLHIVKWLRTDLSAGRIAADSAVNLHLRMSAEALIAGDYEARVRIESNDPARPELDIPVSMRVRGVPIMVLETDTLAFGEVLRGYPVTRPLEVKNRGTDVLHVSRITTDRPELSVHIERLTVPPGADSTVWVTFAVADTGHIEGTITLESNDTLMDRVDIVVTGHAALPPKIGYQPESFAIYLGAGDSTIRSLRLANTGAGPLRWQLVGLGDSAAVRSASTMEPAAAATAVPPSLFLSARPSQGAVMPGGAQDATLVITAKALTPGDYATELIVAHNDPARDTVRIPMHLNIFAVLKGDANADSRINAVDVIYLVNSVWKAGPDPFGTAGDLTCDLAVSVADVMFLIEYIYKSGPAPDCE